MNWFVLVVLLLVVAAVARRFNAESFQPVLELSLKGDGPVRYNEYSVVKEYVDDIARPLDVSGNFQHVLPNEFEEDRSLMIAHAVSGVQPESVSVLQALMAARFANFSVAY